MRSFEKKVIKVNRVEFALKMPATLKDLGDFQIALGRYAASKGEKYASDDFFQLRVDDNELVAYREEEIVNGPNYRGHQEES